MVFFYQKGFLKQHRLSVPVISIGNITLGGVGKTPLVEMLATILKDEGFRTVILTRGYMDAKDTSDTSKTAGSVDSDEAQMLKESLEDVPVLVGRDRITNARTFLKKERADVFILDDGFQHWRLARDLDVVAIDATSPWGNGSLIPRGILREPLSALSRAGIFVLTKTDFGAHNVEPIRTQLKAIEPQALIVETVHEPQHLIDLNTQKSLTIASLVQRNVCCLSGLADNMSFQKTITCLGAIVQKNFSFPDHHVYESSDIERIVNYCREEKCDTVVTTQKDAVKLKEFLKNFQASGISVLVLRIKIVLTKGKDKFLERIHSVLPH